MSIKEKLFSVTAKDCEFKATRGTGAMGYAEDHREQSRNRQLAFKRMAESKEFQSWATVKAEAYLGNIEIEEADRNGVMKKKLLNGDDV